MLPPIKGFVENTLLDWEGRIASILFLPGCNLRCPYCHAGHLVSAAGALESIPFETVEALARKHRGWLDGVVISGGEPTLHEGLFDLCDRIRALGLQVKLDTNGTRPQVLRSLLDLGSVDYVAMDVKAPLNEKYHAAAGVECDVDAIRQSVLALMESDVDYEFRMTVCPALASEEDVHATAMDVRGARRFVLQPFKPELCRDPSLRTVRPYPRNALKQFAAKAGKFVAQCFVRGEPVPQAAE